MKHANPEAALAALQSNQRVFVHGGVATPRALLEGMLIHAPRLQNVELMHLHLEGGAEYADPKFAASFRSASLFVGSNLREALDYDRVDYLPCLLSEIPQLFRSGRRPIDVALVHVSSPDRHGYCSLGTSVDIARAALEVATTVIAQVNPKMPRVHGDGIVHISRLHHWVEIDEALPEAKQRLPGVEELTIGKLVASLVEDGSTLQTGIGSIPDAAVAALKQHRHLGVHSEMWSDGILDLILCGAVDNSLKRVHAGKTVSGFLAGSRRLYDFVDDNPSVIQLGVDYVNSPVIIARNPKVCSINSAVEIDLTGQVCADSLGHRILSGVGGQMDFIRGATLSPGGKPIIALTSRTRKGKSRIVTSLAKGAGVVTTRAHVHYVITEYGIADLYGKTLGERAKALIAIAHPEDREALERQWKADRKKAI